MAVAALPLWSSVQSAVSHSAPKPSVCVTMWRRGSRATTSRKVGRFRSPSSAPNARNSMSAPREPKASETYLSRLYAVTVGSMTQLVRSPSQARHREAARRLIRQSLLTAILGGICVLSLMIWVDAWEIALMPPRGTESLWPVRILTDFGKDSYVLLFLGVTFFMLVVAAAAAREPLHSRLLEFVVRLQYLFCAVAVPLAAGELLKWVAGRGRPFVGGKANPFNFAPFDGTASHASFPSAHAVTAFALAFAVAATWPRARGVMIAYALV